MNAFRSAVVVILAGIAAFLFLPLLLSREPASISSLALGTDDAFALEGLEPRENQIGGGAIRWTRPKATFRFAGLTPGLVDIALQARGHRGEVVMTANGARLGSLLPGQSHFVSRTRLVGSDLDLGVATDGFAAPGRFLGTQVVTLRVEPVPGAGEGSVTISARLGIAVACVLATSAVAQLIAGVSGLLILLPIALLLSMVVPAGLWRSPWLIECATLLSLSALASALVARRAQGGVGARSLLYLVLLLAIAVHGLLPPSPLMIQGDAQLHGNKLGEVARGDGFPTSRTDHEPPFVFPYGVSFYGVLAPLASTAVSNVLVVREGAAFFSVLSILGLALLVGRTSASVAAATLAVWTFAPVNLRTMAFGNLSNIFAQAIFLLFLVIAGLWGRGWGSAILLVSLAALSGTAHLSSFIVLATLLIATLAVRADRQSSAMRPLLLGVALSGAYFASFLPMIAAQIPRLLSERGGSSGVFDPWRLPAQAVSGAGFPLVGLVLLSLLFGTFRPLLPLTRSLALTGLVLGLVALVSPVEVRYVLALIPLLAIAGASVFDPVGLPLHPGIDPGPLRLVRVLALALLLVSVVHGSHVLVEFLPLARR